MFIGPLSQVTGASPKAIRLYESLGLLYGVRRQGRYRIYSEQHVVQVQFIRRAQTLGFKLGELQFVMATGKGRPDWSQVVDFLQQKQSSIREEIDRLQQLDAHIDLVLVELPQCIGTPPAAPSRECDPLPA